MESELSNYLEGIAINVVRQQGLNFTNQKEAQRHVDRTKKEIHTQIQQGNATLIEGLRYLQEDSHGHVHGYVADTCTKLLKHMHSSKKLKIVLDDIMQNERSLLYFTDVVNGLFDSHDFHKEYCAIGVLIALFPLNPQPYIFLGTHIWRKEGMDAAATYYAQIINFIKDPAMYYFAADCFYKNGDREKSIEVIRLALEQAESAGDLDAKEHLLDFFNRL